MSSFPGGASMVTFPWRTWLSASVLSPSGAAYDAYLQRHGYSPSITVAYRHAVGHFAYWFTEEHLRLRRLDESVVRRYVTTHLPTCRCPGQCQRTVVVVQAAPGLDDEAALAQQAPEPGRLRRRARLRPRGRCETQGEQPDWNGQSAAQRPASRRIFDRPRPCPGSILRPDNNGRCRTLRRVGAVFEGRPARGPMGKC